MEGVEVNWKENNEVVQIKMNDFLLFLFWCILLFLYDYLIDIIVSYMFLEITYIYRGNY